MKNSLLKRNILCAALLILICALLAACNGKHTLSTGENTDADYPYSWAEQRNGSFTLRVNGDRPENFSWTCFSDVPDCVSAEYTGDSKGASVFTVKPLEFGIATVTLKLTDDSLPVDSGALLRFAFSVDEKNVMTLVSSDSVALTAGTAAEDSDNQVFWLDGENYVRLYILGDDVWTEEAGENGCYAAGPTAYDGYEYFVISIPEDGVFKVPFVSAKRELRYTLTVTVKDNILTVSDFSTEAYQETVNDPYAGMTEEELANLLDPSSQGAMTAKEFYELAKQQGYLPASSGSPTVPSGSTSALPAEQGDAAYMGEPDGPGDSGPAEGAGKGGN